MTPEGCQLAMLGEEAKRGGVIDGPGFAVATRLRYQLRSIQTEARKLKKMPMTIDDVAFHGVARLDATEIARSLKSRLALIALSEASAGDAIAIAAHSRIPLILVKADPQRPPRREGELETLIIPGSPGGLVCGIVEPTNLRTRLHTHYSARTPHLLDTLQSYERDPDQADRGWRHGWLNRDMPVLQWCEQEGGHLTTLPCRYHSRVVTNVW